MEETYYILTSRKEFSFISSNTKSPAFFTESAKGLWGITDITRGGSCSEVSGVSKLSKKDLISQGYIYYGINGAEYIKQTN